ncbi:alpha/beta fold hydrolase [Psychrobacillus lasiicapitis]|uniref:Alpha/beta hydrolase n=1 Tax=Psychrobacillus lasiicapitis TaxID=1636719 RepID=A0A544SWD6_9BACI|nr:alpha/beta hydrolase [Psychrobacillus lasiicapitis]TQR09507.1 alpha/beta hydrolase [Psychrobacillus lasiicapitis]GGA49733.1 arylesterase [Psychrobacillus lasiicapitis]
MSKLTVGFENGTPIELHIEDVGTGKPVVLIHGWPLSGRSWEKQVPVLVEAGYRVITYDRRGFGQSSQPWNGYEYDTFAADLHKILEHLDLRDVTLVGFSMGGGEVARYIGTYGIERVSRAVLAGAVPPYLYETADNPKGGFDDATIKGLQDGVKVDRIAFLDDFTTNFFASGDRMDLVSEAFRLYNRDIAAFASPKGTLDCIAAFSKTDFRADLDKFNVPTLIIHGDSDVIVPLEVSGQKAHERIPNSQLVVIKGGPHGFNVTHAEEFNTELIQFLKSTESVSI